MSLYSTIACDAELGTEEWDVDEETGEWSGSVVLRTDADLVDDLVADLLLNNRECPFVPYTTKPIALRTAVTYENLDPATPTVGQCNNYTDGLVKVAYGYPNVEDTSDPGIKVSEEIVPNTQVIELDFRDFRWGGQTGDPLRPAEAPGKIEVKIGLIRKLFKVPVPITFNAISLIGHCNQAGYTSPGLGFIFGAETLLYLDPKFNRTIDLSGAQSSDYVQSWSINPNGWNRIWREETSSWEQIYHVGSATPHKTYPASDLSSILF